MLDARLVSSCLSWPSRARPRLSLLSASVGLREKTLLRVNPGATPTLPVQSSYFPFRHVVISFSAFIALYHCTPSVNTQFGTVSCVVRHLRSLTFLRATLRSCSSTKLCLEFDATGREIARKNVASVLETFETIVEYSPLERISFFMEYQQGDPADCLVVDFGNIRLRISWKITRNENLVSEKLIAN